MAISKRNQKTGNKKVINISPHMFKTDNSSQTLSNLGNNDTHNVKTYIKISTEIIKS